MGNKFQGYGNKGVNYFTSLFKEDSRATIANILRLSNYFPSFVNAEDNQVLMEVVGKEELHMIL
jgi:hypothetical protein